MINRVVLIGRLTKDLEVRYTKDQIPVVTFTLAVDRTASRENRVADFFTCTAWRATAEFAGKYASKGALVAIDGRLQTRSYEDKTGRRVTATEVICESFQLLEWRRDNTKNSFTGRDLENLPQSVDNTAFPADDHADDDGDVAGFDISDDDLPF